MTVFEVTRDGTERETAVYDVDPIVDTANPFGNFAVVKIDDRDGTKFEQYERGTRIDIAIDDSGFADLAISPGETVTTNLGTTDTYAGTIANAGTYENQGTVQNQDTAEIARFTGYVVERRETEQEGADALEVEAYSFDQFLRRNTVTNDQTGNLISEALSDIIQTDTPVTYNAGDIDVGDDQELTRSYQGESVENVLRDLAFKSNNEEFGVNDSLEFFFRPRESTHIARGIDNTQWFNYDIPELGKQAINEVEVWFNDGEESVIVDDGTDKLDLQDNLNLPDPGTQRAELNRPDITDIGDAEDEGRKYLEFRNATLSGTVTTFGLYDAQPGDTIDITITPRGIDDEFVIAGMEYRWGRDETILTIIEKRGEQDGILTELNDSVQRVEMSGANRDAASNRITTTTATALVDVQVDADGNTPDGTRFVNDGRRAVRDGWADKGNPAISTLVVGDDNSALSRSNTALQNQTNSASVSEALPDAKSAEYSASITQTGVEELGLETSGGTLICRATFDTPVDLDGTVTVTLDVSNDTSVSRGVLTDDGQTAVRDVLADNSPNIPTDYGYGDDGTAVAESDTALGNEIVSTSLTEVLLADIDTDSEWTNNTPAIADTTPLRIDSGQLETTQICFTEEGENYDVGDEGFDDGSSDPDISNADYASLSGDEASGQGNFAEWSFTPNHTIPGGDFAVYVRNGSNGDGAPGLKWTLEHANGVSYELDTNSTVGVGLGNFDWSELPLFSGGSIETPADLEAGTTHTLRVEITDSNGIADQYQYWVDVVAPLDNRYVADLTFDETVDGNDALSGPEKYADQIETSLNSFTTRRDVTEARFTSTWNDTSNSQYVELANDGSTFTRFNNSDSDSVTFAGPDRGVDVNLGLSRYAADATSTPSNGDSGQSVDVFNLFANPDAVVPDDISKTLTRAIIPPGTITGQTVREAGLKNGSTLLSHHQLADFTVLAGQRIASAETTEFTGDEE